MKNDNNINIKISRSSSSYRAVRIDIVRNGEIIKNNQAHLGNRPKRKRKIDYNKKIMNDPFLFDV